MKGVNKHVVEINNPQNDYFEKAILYIRPEKLDVSPKKLSDEALQYLETLGYRRKIFPWAKMFIMLAIILIIGAVIFGILITL